MKENGEKILGVIGGMGPLASQLFYKMVIENTKASRDQDHINMIILNHATMPDRTRAIMEGRMDQVLEKLARDAEYLAEGGADYVAIPCNTSHTVIDELQEQVSVKLINMIRCTVEYIKDKFTGNNIKAGILATDGTIKNALYQKECEKAGMEPVVPSKECQAKVMKIIYDGIKEGGEIDYSDFEAIEREMKEKGCDVVIMACTELSCFKEMYKLSDYYVDAMEVMAKTAIKLCGKEVK